MSSAMAFALLAAPWAVPALAAEGTAPSAAVDELELAEVVRALSARDGVSCEAVEALSARPVAVLRQVVAEVAMPPYAPMRAANCLVQRHAVEVQADLERWVVEPELKGLGRLVLGAVDQMPIEVAVPVVRRALAEGSDRDLASKRAAAAVAPEIRGLVQR
jgi:hypothetical protein